MPEPQVLLERLEAIGRSLAASDGVLALIGLGSAGAERERLDEYSDLDFFVITQAGTKERFLTRLDWVERVAPVSYFFKNTPDGYKLLFADGIFCEFAIFEPDELERIPFTSERVIWAVSEYRLPQHDPTPRALEKPQETDWLVGEALTNLYVGLARYLRGEKLSAFRFVQGYAVDRLLDLAAQVESAQAFSRDPFSAERRFEQRFPQTARALAGFLPGYTHTPEAALAVLKFLEAHFNVAPAIKDQILRLAVLALEGKAPPHG